MRRCAFTLPEVVVAIALTLLIAGLVFAVTGSAVGEAALLEAVGQTSATMGLARAEAQRRGRVVEVQARPTGANGSPWELATLVWQEPTGDAVEPKHREPDKVEVDAMELPRGVRVRVGRAAFTDRVQESGSGAEPGMGDGTLVLAVFLPDGSGSMLARDLVGADGAAVRLAMNRWTGEVAGVVVPTTEPSQARPEPTP